VIPLHDINPTRTRPVVTIALIVANFVAFFYQLSQGLNISVIAYGLIPAELLFGANRIYPVPGMNLPPGVGVPNLDPAWMTLFTSMFMHGGWMHIIGNMWFLWIFGNNVEDTMGREKYIAFYLLSGVLAAGAQILTGPASGTPMVGASGAVAGVLGAYLVLFPGSRVIALIPLGFIFFTQEVPAWIVLGFWFVLEFVRGVGSLALGDVGGVAYAAHVGGFITGVVLGRVLGRVHLPPPPRPYTRRPNFMDWR